MKISSGWSKGLKILTPEGIETRPTRERVRQSALNMLQPWIAGSKVLDLFAGSGSIGMELVSRGGVGAIFVEKSSNALKALNQNTLVMKERAQKQSISLSPWIVEPIDVSNFLERSPKDQFDIVWADPPYELVQNFLERLGTILPSILNSRGVFVLESKTEDTAFLESWETKFELSLEKRRSYGVSTISIWQKD